MLSRGAESWNVAHDLTARLGNKKSSRKFSTESDGTPKHRNVTLSF
jgi:hypothetical protein